MEAFVNYLNGIIWSSALIYLCLGTGLYFSLRTRFLQVRHFGHMLKIMRRREELRGRCLVFSGVDHVAVRAGWHG